MSEAEHLRTILEKIYHPSPEYSETDLDFFIEEFQSAIPHPGGTDLIFYPHHWGLPEDASVDMILDEALSWRPRVVALTVTHVRKHPERQGLFCVGVELPGKISTQVLSAKAYGVGDVCVVALSGARLSNGMVIKHGFFQRAFYGGEILGPTDRSPGTEFPLADPRQRPEA